MELKFKATRKKSISHNGYRQIAKYGDLDDDGTSDDVINLRDIKQLVIDCDKKTGIFTLKYERLSNSKV